MKKCSERIADLSAKKRSYNRKNVPGTDHNGLAAGIKTAVFPSIIPVAHSQEAPVSIAQEWRLNSYREDPGNAGRHPGSALRLSGDLHLPALTRGINEIFKRHRSLRTGFKYDGNRWCQCIAPFKPFKIPLIDLQDIPDADQWNKAREILLNDHLLPFKQLEGSLVRINLLKLGKDCHILGLWGEHLIADGFSMNIFMEEFITLYNNFCTGKKPDLMPLPIRYTDYVFWQRQWMQSELMEQLLSFWENYLGTRAGNFAFPTNSEASTDDSQGVSHTLAVPLPISEKIKALAKRENVTLFLFLLTVLSLLLDKYMGGNKDVYIYTPISGRTRKVLEKVIGYFNNVLLLHIDLQKVKDFRELLNHTRRSTLEAFMRQDMPLSLISKRLKTLPGASIFFQVGEQSPLRILDNLGLKIEILDINPPPGKPLHDLKMTVIDTSRGFQVDFFSRKCKINSNTIAGMARNFVLLLEQIITVENQNISRLLSCLETG